MATTVTAATEGGTDEDKQESLLEAVASTDIINDDNNDDVENQKSQVVVGEGDDEPSSDIDNSKPAGTDLPLNNPTKQSTLAVTNSNVGIFATNNDDEDDTASVFSFDSYEKQPRIPLRLQHMLNKQQQKQQNNGNNDNNGEGGDNDVPFPSVMGASLEYDPVVNVCPCRCLFFTLKETLCLIMSALGCAVFLAGLVLLCMYLEGTAFA